MLLVKDKRKIVREALKEARLRNGLRQQDVAEVLGYEFTSPSKLKTDLKLHIKWDGYHTPTWEPYINLQKVDIVIKFMKANRLSKYIPAGLK
jgi:hypothetical protein